MASTPEWTVLEKLLLAQAVYKFGEDSWVQIARNLRQHNLLNRQPEFFNQKNCSLQYYLMIEQLESEMRRQTKSAVAVQDMPSVVKLARQLYIQRIDELKHDIKKDKDRFLALISDIDALRSGRQDDMLAAELEKRKNAHNPLSTSEEEERLEPRNTLQDDDVKAITVQEDRGRQGSEAPEPKDGNAHNSLPEPEKDQSPAFRTPAPGTNKTAAVPDAGEEQTPLNRRDDALILEKEEETPDNMSCLFPSPLPFTPRPNTALMPAFAIDEGDHKRRSSSPEDESVKRRRIGQARDDEAKTRLTATAFHPKS